MSLRPFIANRSKPVRYLLVTALIPVGLIVHLLRGLWIGLCDVRSDVQDAFHEIRESK